MILSHRYGFIFLKTNKTAGTSVEIALSKFCGPDDIITPITAEDERLRAQLGHRGPQHHLAPWSDYRFRDCVKMITKPRWKLRFYNHMSAREVRDRIDPGVWDRSFRFCIERNPWDRVVSLYHWQHRTEPKPSFSEFVHSDAPLILKRRGLDLYTIDGRSVVDRVCRFECLADDLEGVRTHLGIPEPLALPQAKSRFRKERQGYREAYGAAERDRVASLFADEIRLAGYEF